MYLCYIDESGTPEVPGTSSHFVLAGIAVPIWHWRDCDREINIIKSKYDLDEAEIHTAWLLRAYQEQSLIENFDAMSTAERRSVVQRLRAKRLLKAQKQGGKAYRQLKKNFRQTESYAHLTRSQRNDFVQELAQCVGNWGFARLFAECIDKLHHDPIRNRGLSVGEQAFEQVVSRFEHFLRATERPEQRNFGLLIHDNNETVAKKHTSMMMRFHRSGTFWTRIMNIIETPLFVNSQLTSMVQIADLCSYALRRYLENDEIALFESIFSRGDRRNNAVVGVRHFCDQGCACTICGSHVATDELPLEEA